MGRDAKATSGRDDVERIGFLLVPQFSMISLVSAVEPLRVANRLKGAQLYSWHIYSVDGQPVESSNGIAMMAEASIAQVDFVPTVIVCSSFEPERHESKALLSWLRRLNRKGCEIGGLCTGAHLLARAGLLNGRRATTHWESLPGFVERFSDIEVTTDLFESDDRFFTCSGGTASLDLMLHRIGARHGKALSVAVSESMLHERIRSHGDHQRMALGLRLGVHHPKLVAIIETMERNLEEPLTVDQLAGQVGISRRQLERLFKNHFDQTPSAFYLKLRLHHARLLLEQTSMTVLQVALACGFFSAPYFSRAYRNLFNRSPREDRRFLRGA